MRSLHQVFAITFIVASTLLGMSWTKVSGAPIELMLGVTPTTSASYGAGVGLAKIVNEHIPGYHCTLVESGGSEANVVRVKRGDIHIGIGTYDHVSAVYGGTGVAKDEYWKEVRWLYNWNPAAFYMVVRADSGVRTLADLNGKKFYAGIVGSSGAANTRAIFKALGIKIDWFLGSLSDAIEAAQNRRIVGFSKAAAGIQLDQATLELQATTPIYIVPFSEDDLAAALRAVPGIYRVNVPTGAIKGLPNLKAFSTWGYLIGFLTSSKLSQKLGYEIMKASVEHWHDIFVPSFPRAKDVDPVKDTLGPCASAGAKARTIAPLHAGVVQYFRERRLEVPPMLIPPEYHQ